MAFNEKISLVIDVVAGRTRSTLSQLGADLKATDGFFNKAKVSAGALGGFLKENMATAALAGGTALVAFGVKAVGAFQDTALGAGRLRDALGVTAEEASRFQEVGKDLGVGVEAIEASIGRMNRTAASSPAAFDAIGASIVRNQDGTINTTETFIAAADALSKIPDAARRAEAGQKIFGRGWQSIAEIIMEGGEGIRDMMASVEDAKIISDEEIDKSRDMRDALDELKGAGESLALMIGEELVPAITAVAEVTNTVIGPLQGVKDVFEDITDLPLAKQIYEQLAPWERWNRDIGAVQRALNGGKAEIKAVTDLSGQQKDAIEDLTEVVREYGDATQYASRQESAAAEAKVNAERDAVAAAERATEAREAEHESRQLAREGIELYRQQLGEEIADHETLAGAIRDNASALEDQANAMLAASDPLFALHDAEQQFRDAVEKSTTALDEEGTTIYEVQQAHDAVAQSAANVAAQHVEMAKQAAAADGKTLSLKKSIDVANSSLLEQAAALQGPERQAILDHVGRVNGIPTDVQTLVSALIEQGKVDEANKVLTDTSKPRDVAMNAEASEAEAKRVESRMNELSRLRESPIIADAETFEAEAELDHTARDRTSIIYQQVVPGHIPDQGLMPGGGGPGAESIGSGSGGLSPRVKKMLEMADAQLKRAADLKKLADALREQAKATKDVEDKEKLLDKVEKLSEQRLNALRKARDLAERAADKHADSIRRESGALDEQADKLRDHANRLRELAAAAAEAVLERAAAFAESNRERASSLSELVDAQLSFEDAQRQTRETLAHAARAFTTEGVTRAQQQEAINDARQAALAQADAEVERARERAEAAGREFTEADAARVMQRSLERQAKAIGGPVGKALRETIREFDFPKMIRLFERADKREEQAEKRAERIEERADKRADKEERTADKWERLAERWARLADRIDGAPVHIDEIHVRIGNDDLEAIVERVVRRRERRTTQAIMAGRR